MVKSSLVSSHMDWVNQETQKAFLYFARIFFSGNHKPISKKESDQTKHIILQQIADYRAFSLVPYILYKDYRAFVKLMGLFCLSIINSMKSNIVKCKTSDQLFQLI